MITLENVTKEYEDEYPGLINVSLHIDKGEFVFVVGKSGSGKTTLIRVLLKEIEVNSGHIVVNEYNYRTMKRRELPYLRRQMGVVFQDFKLLKDRNIYDNVAFAMKVVETANDKIDERVMKVLDTVGLADRKDALPEQLSGGEQQRVAIARAIVNEPVLVLADEPTGNLDPASAEEIMNLLEHIGKNGTTVLVATHSKELVNKMGKRVVSLCDGKIEQDEIGGNYDI